ncbi:unnamed protein product [Acanthoscelides obtectus]|uniref:Uncharacterized protein n=1 Tax=Acanthoscelides obtectus TaxID=200917 RepID=A0A9P0PFF0_ACAOB|nr:unnamed protein product [Acanthoscelides obtectus]CAK1667633.1 hypothetical protein AOBTE_LOCUS25956 [Acanthoscelides obtectus]
MGRFETPAISNPVCPPPLTSASSSTQSSFNWTPVPAHSRCSPTDVVPLSSDLPLNGSKENTSISTDIQKNASSADGTRFPDINDLLDL